jgi:hypothetical protein
MFHVRRTLRNAAPLEKGEGRAAHRGPRRRTGFFAKPTTGPFVLPAPARILWAMIVSGEAYDEKKAFAITEASTARRLRNLQNQAKAMNMTLVPAQ